VSAFWACWLKLMLVAAWAEKAADKASESKERVNN
jgi:hypothetical protein